MSLPEHPTIEQIKAQGEARRQMIRDTWTERTELCEDYYSRAWVAVPDACETAAKALIATEGPRGPYHDAAQVVVGALLKAGWTFTPPA